MEGDVTMRSLKDNLDGAIDLGVVIMVGIVFAGMMVIAYMIWTLREQFFETLNKGTGATNLAEGMRTLNNTTDGFDDAINLILVAITIFILAIAISALLMLRGR